MLETKNSTRRWLPPLPGALERMGDCDTWLQFVTGDIIAHEHSFAIVDGETTAVAHGEAHHDVSRLPHYELFRGIAFPPVESELSGRPESGWSIRDLFKLIIDLCAMDSAMEESLEDFGWSEFGIQRCNLDLAQLV